MSESTTQPPSGKTSTEGQSLPTPAHPTATPPPAWMPPPVTPLGDYQGEGAWEPYMHDAQGAVVAYRAFLHPDPDRPYAVAALVAFDTKAVRLHYMVGFQDPYTKTMTKRLPGIIPPELKQPGVLLAAFNGGFKSGHGNFGSMVGGVVTVPPRDGLATIAMDARGTISMGEWGRDLKNAKDYLDLRQNGPLVLSGGQPTEKVNDPSYWGFTLDGQTVTWRSGLGLSRDGSVLYYIAGSYITIEKLAKTMQAAQVWTGMQLDINNYWVHFDAMRVQDGVLEPEPLLLDAMNQNTKRYLQPFSRDFFFVTLAVP